MGSSVILLGDQLPVPSQQGVRCDNVGDLGKSLSPQRFGLYGQSPALIVIEAHPPAPELFSKHPILLAKIFNDLQLAVVHPPGDGDQQKSEWVEHSLRIQNPLSRPPSRSSEISHLHADPVFGPYAISNLANDTSLHVFHNVHTSTKLARTNQPRLDGEHAKQEIE